MEFIAIRALLSLNPIHYDSSNQDLKNISDKIVTRNKLIFKSKKKSPSYTLRTKSLSVQEHRIRRILQRTKNARQVKQGIFQVPYIPKDDDKNYEESFVSFARTINPKVLRSGKSFS